MKNNSLEITAYQYIRRSILQVAVFVLFLYAASLYNFLLFRVLVELFSIIVSFGIFAVAWNSRKLDGDTFLFFVGIAFLFIGFFDILHFVSRPEFGVLENASIVLSQKIRSVERFLEALSFLLALIFLKIKLGPRVIFLGYLVLSLAIFLSLFYGNILPAVSSGSSVSSKTWSNDAIIFILGLAVAVLVIRRKDFDFRVGYLLLLSLVLKILDIAVSEPYIGVYSIRNFGGYSLRFASFYLLYKAVIETGLMTPYWLLFKNLKRNEESLKKARTELEFKVKERTTALSKINRDLKKEIEERLQAEEDLVDSYKHLGFINRRVSLLLDINRHYYKKRKKEVLGYILDSAVNLSRADVGIIYFKFDDGFHSLMHWGLVGERGLRFIQGGDLNLPEHLAKDRSLVKGFPDEYGFENLNFSGSLKYFMALPFFIKQDLKGFLFLGFKRRKSLDTQEIDFYNAFSVSVTLALINAGIIG